MASEVALLFNHVSKRKIIWIVLLIATSLTFPFSYHWLLHGARSRKNVVERDQIEVRGFSSSQAGGNYDPYFNRVNFIPFTLEVERR